MSTARRFSLRHLLWLLPIGLGLAVLNAREADPPASAERAGTGAGAGPGPGPGSFLQARQSRVDYLGAAKAPAMDCRQLRDMRVANDVTLRSATHIAARGEVPGHCQVRGVIAAQIEFDIRLPDSWNQRFYMFGNGGYAGENLASPLRQLTRDAALKAHFLVADTNTGHDAAREPLASFAASSAKVIDYAFRAVHRTAELAKQVGTTYYAGAPRYAYWDACSTGGRQGLISAQRYPEDFNGILAGAPVSDFIGTMLGYLWNERALRGVGLTPAKLNTLGQAVTATCDASDGLQDGVIDNPPVCDFDPARDVRQCPPGRDDKDCLTAAQAAAIAKVHQGPRRPDGTAYFPGWPLGAETLGASTRDRNQQISGWLGWLVPAAAGKPSMQQVFGESFIKHMAFGRPRAGITPDSFDFARDLAKTEPMRQLLNATNPDLGAFRRSGGKLLMYHGWADPALNAQMSVNYYQQALAVNGPSTPEFFRLFMVPGMFHCKGGNGTDRFDGMTALIEWVEQGQAPDRIAAARVEGGKVVRSRPLCPYPQVASYAGSGSIDEQQNFVCKAP